MCNKDIYLKMYADNSWELYNQNSLELCSGSHQDYLKTFMKLYTRLPVKSNTLIVGGGDFQIASHISEILFHGSELTVVDPFIKDYEHFVKYYTEMYAQIGIQDKINAGNLKVNKIELKFSESYDILEKNMYDTIIVDCSEEIVKETSEIYCEAFIKSCSKILSKSGFLYLYIPKNVENFLEIVYKYFSFQDQSVKYIEAWDEFAHIVKLKKR